MTARYTISLSSAIACLLSEVAFAGSNATCLAKADPHRYHSPEFEAKVHKLIEPAVKPLLQMRVDPSFDQDHAVSLHGTPENSSLARASHLFVSHRVADRNIGYSLPRYHNGRDEKVSVAVTTAELPRPVAQRVYDIWCRMLRRAGHPDEILRADPTTVEFSCRDNHGSHYAQAYEPHACDDSFLLAEIGRGLIAWCHPEKISRSAALRLLEKRTRAAEDFLKNHARD